MGLDTVSRNVYTAPMMTGMHPAPPLRPYQQEGLNAITKALDRGVRAQLVVWPTAAGKSSLFANLPKHLDIERMLVLAHREELLDQAAKRIKQYNPHLDIGVEQAENYAEEHSVVVASVQSIGKESQRIRRERWSPEHFDVIIVDEAHHAGAKTYLNILRYFKPKLLLGVTATPSRGDGVVLANIFDEVSHAKTIPDLYEEGESDSQFGPYLSRLRGVRISSDTNLSKISVRAGDFAENELAIAVNTDSRNSKIISAYESHIRSQGRKHTLVFAVDVAHAKALTAQFQDRGHEANCVLGATNRQERADIFQSFRDGMTSVLINVGVATEGIDIPNIDSIILARPVLSPTLFFQMIGRGLRVAPNKTDCLIMDVVDTVGRHNVVTIGEAFGVRSVDFKGEDVYEKAMVVKQAQELGINFEDGMEIGDLEKRLETIEGVRKGTIFINTRAQVIDVLQSAAPADEVEKESKFPWIKINNDKYILSMFDKSVFALEHDALGRWVLIYCGEQWECEKAKGVPLRWADNIVCRNTEQKVWRARSVNARWRQAPASDAQRRLLKDKFKIAILPSNLSKGAATDIIDYLINLRKTAPRLVDNHVRKEVQTEIPF